MAGNTGFGYIDRPSPVHRLSGATKLLMAVFFSTAAMITYDTRYLAALIIGASVLFALSKIRFSDMRVILIVISVMMVINCIAIYLFSPEEGVTIYGTRHQLAHVFGNYYITTEQLFYMLNVTLKYFSVMPVALVFIMTTEPSEFASSLNRIGIGYRTSYAVALALRYIPDIRRDFVNIRQAQQARGIDTTKKASLLKRLKGVTAILFPLIFTGIDRIDVVANAMELRRFGKNKKRTWYRAKPFRAMDFIIIIGSALLIAVSVYLNFVNGGRFYNPFIR